MAEKLTAKELTAEDVPKRRRTDLDDGFHTRLEALETTTAAHGARIGAIERADARMGEMFRAVIATVDGLATALTIIAPANAETKAMLTKLVQRDDERTAREETVRQELEARQDRRDAREEHLVRWFRWLLSGLAAVATMMTAVIIGSLPSALHVWFYPLFAAIITVVCALTSYLYIWRKRP